MKIGISAFAWTSHLRPAHLQILPELRDLGVEGFEVPIVDPESLPLDEIRAATEACGIECTGCALLPRHCNPISPDPQSRDRARNYLRRCIEACARMGARVMGGPLYAPIGYLPDHRPTAEEWDWAVASFRAVGDLLDSNGIVLCIEPVNRSETFLIRTAAEAKRLCDAVGHPRVGVTLDTFHANIEERDFRSAILDLNHRLRHVHASENDRGPIGRGHLPFGAIVAALREIGYSGYLMIEGFGFDQTEAQSPGRLWADQEVSPRVLLTESVRCLRSLLQEGVR